MSKHTFDLERVIVQARRDEVSEVEDELTDRLDALARAKSGYIRSVKAKVQEAAQEDRRIAVTLSDGRVLKGTVYNGGGTIAAFLTDTLGDSHRFEYRNVVAIEDAEPLFEVVGTFDADEFGEAYRRNVEAGILEP